MGKHCLQLVLTLLLLFSPYVRRFSEQTDKKNPCWAVFSVMFKMADTTNACVLPTTSKTQGNTLLVLLLCNVSYHVTYRIMYRIVTTASGYVSYHRKMYRCRPNHSDWCPDYQLRERGRGKHISQMDLVWEGLGNSLFGSKPKLTRILNLNLTLNQKPQLNPKLKT